MCNQADLKHMGLRDAIEQLPMHGPKPSCLDDDMLTVKATSQAALICMQVWSLSSFEVSRQLLTDDLNHVSSVSLLMTASMALANKGLF